MQWPTKRRWLLAGKEMTDAKTSSRTSVFCALPYSCPSGSLQLVYNDTMRARELAYLLAVLNSLPFDYFARQKVSGSHLTATILRQLPIPAMQGPESGLPDWLADRVVENAAALSHGCVPFSEDLLAEGVAVAAPGATDQRRSEIDAAMFLLYGLKRQDVVHVLQSFKILNEMEVSRSGELQTLPRVLALYDAMQTAIDTGTEYQTIPEPPPGGGPPHAASTQPSATSGGTP